MQDKLYACLNVAYGHGRKSLWDFFFMLTANRAHVLRRVTLRHDHLPRNIPKHASVSCLQTVKPHYLHLRHVLLHWSTDRRLLLSCKARESLIPALDSFQHPGQRPACLLAGVSVHKTHNRCKRDIYVLDRNRSYFPENLVRWSFSFPQDYYYYYYICKLWYIWAESKVVVWFMLWVV